MARQGNQARRCNAPLSVETCEPRFLPHCPLDLHIIRKSKRSIGANEIHTMVHKWLILNRGFFEPTLSLVKANLHELVQCCLEFLTMKVSLVCHVPFPKRPSRLQITDSSNATINWKIPSLRAGASLVDDAHGLGNLPDAHPHCIIYPLCCQATIILPNAHGFCCPLADCNTGILSPDGDL